MLARHQTVLVTGGAGFIGSHLCELMLARGFSVHVVDDLRSGKLANLPFSSASFSFEQLAVGNPATLDRLEKRVARSSFVFHLASPVGVSVVHDEPGATVNSIMRAGMQLVELCRRLHRPLLYTSSSEVYGPDPPCPVSEECMLTLSATPRFSYAVAKLAVEHLVADLNHRHRVPTWIVRLFNIAGPRQRPSAGVVAAFAAELAAGRQLSIHGDGTQTRCFLHVRDAVGALARIADCSELCGRPVNLGGEACVSIRELAALMQSESGQRDLIAYRTYDDAFGRDFVPVVQREPDTRLLRTATGWQPRLTLSDIIRDSIEHARRAAAEPVYGSARSV
jgi:UDP-glucose 4-epimerase